MNIYRFGGTMSTNLEGGPSVLGVKEGAGMAVVCMWAQGVGVKILMDATVQLCRQHWF